MNQILGKNMTIESPDDWWFLLKKYKKEIQELVDRFYPKDCEIDIFIESEDNETMLEILNETWTRAPDLLEVSTIPGWDELCDLCSEDWVFYEN